MDEREMVERRNISSTCQAGNVSGQRHAQEAYSGGCKTKKLSNKSNFSGSNFIYDRNGDSLFSHGNKGVKIGCQDRGSTGRHSNAGGSGAFSDQLHHNKLHHYKQHHKWELDTFI